jgi:acyl dehydratase
MIAFAESFDPQPFHVNEAAALGTLLGGLSASGWYVCAKICAALRSALIKRSLRVEVAGAEQIILFSPIRPDDALAATVRPEPLRSCACGGHGMMISVDVVRSDGACVARMSLNFVIGDGVKVDAEGTSGCSFREGRKGRNSVRHRIHDIPFFEKIEIGDEIDLGRYTFGLTEVEEFLVRTCNGETGARQDLPSSVPAWHIPAAWMQCMVRHYEATTGRPKGSMKPFPRLGPAAGFKQLRWNRRLLIGEVVSFRGWAERKLIIPSHKDWGLLVVGAEGIDINGKTVVSFYPQMLLQRAHPLQPT